MALIKDSDHSPSGTGKYQPPFYQKVDGILFSAISLTEEHKQLLMNSPVPVVVLAQNFEEGITVTMDDYTAGKTMGSFMGSRVRGKIAYLGVEEEDEAVGIFRRQGVLEGIKESGSQVMTVETGDYSYVSGQEMMEKVLEKGIPDGVICATDRLAFGAYRILQKHGFNSGAGISSRFWQAMMKANCCLHSLPPCVLTPMDWAIWERRLFLR